MRQYQPSNVARELKQKLEVVRGGEVGSHDFVLGQEPQGGVPKEHQGGIPKEGLPKEPDVKPSTASRLHFSCCYMPDLKTLENIQVPIPAACDKLP